jgi:hypothetical protein
MVIAVSMRLKIFLTKASLNFPNDSFKNLLRFDKSNFDFLLNSLHNDHSFQKQKIKEEKNV